ncbi:LysR family transcriptional regulator [Ruegeria marina]|uniref:Transcriptional regulator, LysR family n=1 Tax=Ruegeria marina TaxID=639004 RepID=A0A1G7ENP9_9RHOB|nr:LysR family transcriptional regulator [Ruegeria marina]SDE65310.1 transcriptional regulator, LysR family [Ruegeria marina]
MTKLPHVTWLRAFEAAARNSSFTSAADELNLTPAAVSQQIKLLEQHFGVQLFTRQPRGVALTDMGHAYAQPIRKAFAEMQEATNGLFGSKKKRIVRARASISYAAIVLAPQLGGFHEAHPDIEVQLTTAVWTDRIDDEAIDVEIRYGHGDWDERDIRHLSGHRLAEVVCHPAFAASFGEDLSIQTLAAHAVQVIGSESDWSLMSEQFGLELPPVAGAIKADSSLIALQMISSGIGAAIISEDFSSRYIEQGLLISPFEYRLPLQRSFFLVVQDNLQERSEVNQFCEWLSEQHRKVSP